MQVLAKSAKRFLISLTKGSIVKPDPANEDERKIYDLRMRSLADTANQIDSARTEGLAKGHERGCEETCKSMVIKASRSGMLARDIANIFELSKKQVAQWLSEAQ